MKLLLVGSASNYAIEKPYLRYFSQHAGISAANLFPAQNKFLAYYQRSVINKIKYRFGVSNILSTINDDLKKTILEERPDVVFVFKGMEILPHTLKWIRSKGIKLVNYNPDNPFVFTGSGSGNKNVSHSIELFDLHFTYDHAIKERLVTEFKLPVCILPFGFDLGETLYAQCAAQTEVLKVCFVGNPDRQRARFILALANAGIAIDVIGHQWQKMVNHPNITICEPVYEDALWMTLSRYRVQLNLMRVHNPNSHNMRTFEIPGAGGIQLAPDTPDHRAFFQPGKEIFLYSDVAGCVSQINDIISLSESDSKQIRMAARMRSLNSHYTYHDRADQVVSNIKALF
jgi:spore maturation protein CgeB